MCLLYTPKSSHNVFPPSPGEMSVLRSLTVMELCGPAPHTKLPKPLCSVLSNFQPLKSIKGSGPSKGRENIRPHKKSRFANNLHVRLKLIQQDESHLPIPALMSSPWKRCTYLGTIGTTSTNSFQKPNREIFDLCP